MASPYDVLLDPAPAAAAPSPYDALLSDSPATSPYDALLEASPAAASAPVSTSPESGLLPSLAAEASKQTLYGAAGVADVAERDVRGVVETGKPFRQEDQSQYDAIRQSINDLRDESARASEGGGGGADPREAVLFDQLRQMEQAPRAERLSGQLAEAGRGAFPFYGANPDAKNPAAQIGRSVGGVLALAPSIVAGPLGLPVAALQGASSAYGETYDNAINAGSDDADAQKAAAQAAIKTAPGLAAYLIGGHLAGEAVSALAQSASPIVKGILGSIGAGAANVTISSTLRALEGGDWKPTIQTLSTDALFGILHGAGEWSKASTEAKQRAADEIASRDSSIAPLTAKAASETLSNAEPKTTAAEITPIETTQPGVAPKTDTAPADVAGDAVKDRLITRPAAEAPAAEPRPSPEPAARAEGPQSQTEPATVPVAASEKATRTFRSRPAADSFGSETSPISAAIIDQGGLMSERTAKKTGRYERNAELYDDKPTLKHPSHNKIYSASGLTPDEMAQSLFEQGLIRDQSATSMWQAIDRESQTARTIQREAGQQKTQAKELTQQGKAFDKAARDTSATAVKAKDLQVGDTVKVGTETMKVTAIDPESFDVTLEDGKKFGVQEVKDGEVIYGEHNSAQPADDWTSATDEGPKQMKRGGAQAGAVTLPKVTLENRKMSELDRATTERSGKLQRSTDDARRAQGEIKKVIPSETRQGAVSVWVEANGDAATLAAWEAAAKGKEFREAAKGAQSLTPKELAIAQKVQASFKALESRGNKYDVLKSHRDNYIPHVWDLEKSKGSGFGGGKLQQNFKFSKARTFGTFAAGDAAGFKPKTLAIGKLLPAYLHEMNKVIADRQFVEELSHGTAKDGRPLVVPRGRVSEIETEAGGKAYLANPRGMKGAKDADGEAIDTHDYKTLENQPALHDWRWEGKDADGNPIYMKDDLALHPEAAKRLNAMLGRSAIREWYNEPSTGTAAIPKAIAKALDTSQAVMKREMFSLLAPFHQVQEGWHGIAHLVNPFFDVPKINLRDAAQLDATKHGLMLLPDKISAQNYMEGVGGKSGFISQISRKFGGKAGEAVSDVIDGYQDYLFHKYIPGLKFKTYEAIRGRNMKRFAEEMSRGELTEADVKLLSAEQTNAAYGHLNYALLDRNPTIQHLLQLGLLAPDFLEARGRFTAQAAKGLIGGKVGAEQFKAIATIAAIQAAIAYTATKLGGDEWDPKHPFEAIHGGRRYTLRSVPEDIASMIADTRQFFYGRMNPLTVKGGYQLATGLNYRGEKTTTLQTIEELLAQYIPITARALPGVRSLTETGKQSPVSPLEQLAGSLGLRISRKSPITDTYKLASDWLDKKGVEKDRGSYPVSKYQQLRYALEDGDLSRAGEEYDKLKKDSTPQKIALGFKESVNHPFTKSQAMDAEFRASLSPKDRAVYDLAKMKRELINTRFRSLR